MTVMLSFLLPAEVSWREEEGGRGGNTFDGIGFGELTAVNEGFLGDCFPGHSFGETKIHVCGGQVVHMELVLA